MALTKNQKFKLAFNFTVSNTQSTFTEDRFGNQEVYGINTRVFENLENTLNLRNLSEGRAKKIHRKLVWEKFKLYDIQNIEILIKLHDLFFIYGEDLVTEIVRSILADIITPPPEFSSNIMGKKEIKLINKLKNDLRSQEFLNRLIQDSQLKTTQSGTVKRIEKLPTI